MTCPWCGHAFRHCRDLDGDQVVVVPPQGMATVCLACGRLSRLHGRTWRQWRLEDNDDFTADELRQLAVASIVVRRTRREMK